MNLTWTKFFSLLGRVGLIEIILLFRDFFRTFEASFYRRKNRSKVAFLTPRLHYLLYGQLRNFHPNRQFDPAEYALKSPQTNLKTSFPFFHYLLNSNGAYPKTEWDLEYLEIVKGAVNYERSLVLHMHLYHREMIEILLNRPGNEHSPERVKRGTGKNFRLTSIIKWNSESYLNMKFSIHINSCTASVILPFTLQANSDELQVYTSKERHLGSTSCQDSNIKVSISDSRAVKVTVHQPIVISLDGITGLLLQKLPIIEKEKRITELLNLLSSRGSYLASLASRNKVNFSFVTPSSSHANSFSLRFQVNTIEIAAKEMDSYQRILLVSHEDSYTGAPIYLKQMFYQLIHEGYDVQILSMRPRFRNGVFQDLGKRHFYLEDFATRSKGRKPILENWILTSSGEKAMQKALEKTNPDLVLANSLSAVDSIRIAYRNNKATVLYVHESWKLDGPNWTTKDIFQNRVMEALEAVNLVLFGSTATKNHWEQSGSAMFGQVVPTYRKVLGFDQQSRILMRKNIRFKLKIPEQSRVFLSVATFEPRKRVKDILKAFNEIDYEDSHLILVGVNSNDLVNLSYLFLRKQAKIHAVGTRKHLDDFYAAADCFIFASEQETMPLALQEAAIHGIPRIVSMYPGYDELIPNKDYAYLYPTGDVSALKDKMNYFIENYEKSLVVAKLSRNFQESRLLENNTKLYKLLDIIYENRVSITPAHWSNEKS